jgi:error-prone DNA polymerase
MRLGEHVAADFQTARLSLKAHPMAILRDRFRAEHWLSAGEATARRDGARARTAGIVLVRQRPGNGNAIFITLEDETGVVNLVLWARTFETYRRQVMGARLLAVEGKIQRSPEGVVHLMAERLFDRTADLALLSQAHDARTQFTRADEFLHPQPSRGRHPRDVRVLPKSRDFH